MPPVNPILSIEPLRRKNHSAIVQQAQKMGQTYFTGPITQKMPRLFSFRFLLLFYPHSRLDVKDIIVDSYHEKLFQITSEDYE